MNLNTEITDFDGNSFPDKPTIKSAVMGSLINVLRGDETLAAEQKVKMFELAMRIHGAEQIELTAEDVSLIKERVGKAYPPMVVGRVFQAIDPASVKKA